MYHEDAERFYKKRERVKPYVEQNRENPVPTWDQQNEMREREKLARTEDERRQILMSLANNRIGLPEEDFHNKILPSDPAPMNPNIARPSSQSRRDEVYRHKREQYVSRNTSAPALNLNMMDLNAPIPTNEDDIVKQLAEIRRLKEMLRAKEKTQQKFPNPPRQLPVSHVVENNENYQNQNQNPEFPIFNKKVEGWYSPHAPEKTYEKKRKEKRAPQTRNMRESGLFGQIGSYERSKKQRKTPFVHHDQSRRNQDENNFVPSRFAKKSLSNRLYRNKSGRMKNFDHRDQTVERNNDLKDLEHRIYHSPKNRVPQPTESNNNKANFLDRIFSQHEVLKNKKKVFVHDVPRAPVVVREYPENEIGTYENFVPRDNNMGREKQLSIQRGDIERYLQQNRINAPPEVQRSPYQPAKRTPNRRMRRRQSERTPPSHEYENSVGMNKTPPQEKPRRYLSNIYNLYGQSSREKEVAREKKKRYYAELKKQAELKEKLKKQEKEMNDEWEKDKEKEIQNVLQREKMEMHNQKTGSGSGFVDDVKHQPVRNQWPKPHTETVQEVPKEPAKQFFSPPQERDTKILNRGAWKYSEPAIVEHRLREMEKKKKLRDALDQQKRDLKARKDKRDDEEKELDKKDLERLERENRLPGQKQPQNQPRKEPEKPSEASNVQFTYPTVRTSVERSKQFNYPPIQKPVEPAPPAFEKTVYSPTNKRGFAQRGAYKYAEPAIREAKIREIEKKRLLREELDKQAEEKRLKGLLRDAEEKELDRLDEQRWRRDAQQQASPSNPKSNVRESPQQPQEPTLTTQQQPQPQNYGYPPTNVAPPANAPGANELNSFLEQLKNKFVKDLKSEMMTHFQTGDLQSFMENEKVALRKGVVSMVEESKRKLAEETEKLIQVRENIKKENDELFTKHKEEFKEFLRYKQRRMKKNISHRPVQKIDDHEDEDEEDDDVDLDVTQEDFPVHHSREIDDGTEDVEVEDEMEPVGVSQSIASENMFLNPTIKSAKKIINSGSIQMRKRPGYRRKRVEKKPPVRRSIRKRSTKRRTKWTRQKTELPTVRDSIDDVGALRRSRRGRSSIPKYESTDSLMNLSNKNDQSLRDMSNILGNSNERVQNKLVKKYVEDGSDDHIPEVVAIEVIEEEEGETHEVDVGDDEQGPNLIAVDSSIPSESSFLPVKKT